MLLLWLRRQAALPLRRDRAAARRHIASSGEPRARSARRTGPVSSNNNNNDQQASKARNASVKQFIRETDLGGTLAFGLDLAYVIFKVKFKWVQSQIYETFT